MKLCQHSKDNMQRPWVMVLSDYRSPFQMLSGHKTSALGVTQESQLIEKVPKTVRLKIKAALHKTLITDTRKDALERNSTRPFLKGDADFCTGVSI